MPQPDQMIPFPASNARLDSGKSATRSSAISVSEIESLLRSAQENRGAAASQSAIDELGPGDVQYFRGESTKLTEIDSESLVQRGWFEATRPSDESLQPAEPLLLGAMSSSQLERATSQVTAANASSREPSDHRGLSLQDLGNLDLDISIELGRTELLIEEVLKLREGAVVSLDKLAGDPVDIIANGRLVARGELLVIDGKFGVRLSEVL